MLIRPLAISPKQRPTAPRRLCLSSGGQAALLIAVVAGFVCAEPAKADPPAASETVFQRDVAPFLKTYCLTCHGENKPKAGLSLGGFTDAGSAAKDAERWQLIQEMIALEAMPPEDAPRHPSGEERQKVLAWVDDHLFAVDCSGAHDPGRVTIRRLNRAEYDNSVRDLLGVDFHPAADFPSDEVGYGFDNIGDVLSLPPLLLEKYVDAAEDITARAIVADPSTLLVQRKSGNQLDVDIGGEGDERNDSISLASVGGAFEEFELSGDGEYILRGEASADQAGDEPAKMEFRIDGEAVKTFEIQGDDETGVYEFKLTLSQGKTRFAAWFINDYYDENAENRRERDRNMEVYSLEVEGPLGTHPTNLPETHRRIVIARPGPQKTVEQAAREIFTAFLPRAFRRPVEPHEVEPLVRLVTFVAAQGETFEQAVSIGVQAALVSPHFLFRVEHDPAADDPDGIRRLSEYELASRLSYFLWSSMPDEELFKHARRGDLHEPTVLAAQVRRMLADPKAEALTENFAAQWLNLRNLAECTPDPEHFEDFDDELRDDMRRETELLFETIVKEDRSILDFLGADFTFVNERLAEHYDLPDVDGEEFRRISLADTRRRGVLTHASILTLTSNPNRTSPVKRGKWILENLLDQAPPDPPPNVPQLEVTAKENPDLTLRQQLELHRANPTCASCHKVMDPLGLAFEHFDPVGRWREKEDGKPIDASGRLPGGEEFNGAVELVAVLKSRQDDFSRCLAEKMLTYALGRGLERYDTCAVDEIVASLKENDYHFSALVLAIVRSDPFLKRRGFEG